jgi:methyl-accepting chemotaxis protein
VAEAGEHMAMAVDQTNQAINQITQTIQQIAFGTAQQVDSIAKTSNSAGQMAYAIAGVAQGAQEQAVAVTKSAAATAQMSKNIQHVAQNAGAGARSAAEATLIARSGAKTVAETIAGMQNIKAKVGASAQKVKEMGARSRQIGAIVETISSIASQTNMLALNAAIEAARVSVKSHAIGERMLDRHLAAQAHLIAELLVIGNREWSTVFWQKLAQQTSIDTFCITDEDGVVVYCDDPAIVGFRFSNDPKDQTYEFRALLHQNNGLVCQAAQPRGVDGQMYKYVGVSRRDRRGIVQVGFKATSLNQFRLQTGGFAVVADEVRKLAEKSAAATREIAQLVEGIQQAVSEAVQAMDTGAREVEIGAGRADRAGQALTEIMKAVEAVTGQVEEIAAATQKMQASSTEMVSAMESVSAVVEENTATTEEMAANSAEVTEAINLIAGISQENGAAVQEVSAAAEEMSAQVSEMTQFANRLNTMTQELHQLMTYFQFASDNGYNTASVNYAAAVPARVKVA